MAPHGRSSLSSAVPPVRSLPGFQVSGQEMVNLVLSVFLC